MLTKRVAIQRTRVVLENLKRVRENPDVKIDPLSWGAFLLEYVSPVVLISGIFPERTVRRMRKFCETYQTTPVDQVDIYALEMDADDLWSRIIGTMPDVK